MIRRLRSKDTTAGTGEFFGVVFLSLKIGWKLSLTFDFNVKAYILLLWLLFLRAWIGLTCECCVAAVICADLHNNSFVDVIASNETFSIFWIYGFSWSVYELGSWVGAWRPDGGSDLRSRELYLEHMSFVCRNSKLNATNHPRFDIVRTLAYMSLHTLSNKKRLFSALFRSISRELACEVSSSTHHPQPELGSSRTDDRCICWTLISSWKVVGSFGCFGTNGLRREKNESHLYFQCIILTKTCSSLRPVQGFLEVVTLCFFMSYFKVVLPSRNPADSEEHAEYLHSFSSSPRTKAVRYTIGM